MLQPQEKGRTRTVSGSLNMIMSATPEKPRQGQSNILQNISMTSSREYANFSPGMVAELPTEISNNLTLGPRKLQAAPQTTTTLTTFMTTSNSGGTSYKPPTGVIENSSQQLTESKNINSNNNMNSNATNNNSLNVSAFRPLNPRQAIPSSRHQSQQSNAPLMQQLFTADEQTGQANRTDSHRRVLSQIILDPAQRMTDSITSSAIKQAGSTRNLAQQKGITPISLPVTGHVRFADDDFYHYFVKGTAIDDGKEKHQQALIKQQSIKDSGTPASAAPTPVQVKHAKKILKKKKSFALEDTESRRSTGLSKTLFESAANQPLSVQEKQRNLNSLLGLECQDGSEKDANNPSDKELIERFINGAMSTGNLRQRSNSLRFNAQGVTGSKLEQLGDYEKRDYIRRASDAGRMQSLHSINYFEGMIEKMKEATGVVCQRILRILQLKLVKETSNDETQLFSLFLNASILAIIMLIYPACMIVVDAQNTAINLGLADIIITSVKSSHYAGHLILTVLVLLSMRSMREVRDFYLAKEEKVSFKLVFAEIVWGSNKRGVGKGSVGGQVEQSKRNCEVRQQLRQQQKAMAEKWSRIDKVLENIDDAEGGEIVGQVAIVVIVSVLLLTANIALLFFFILDDSKLLKMVLDSNDQQQFSGRLVVSFVTSAMLLADSYVIRLLFWSIKQRMGFAFYEKAQLYLLFAFQMSVLLVYSAKTLSYVNPSFELNYIGSQTLSNSQHLAYLNLTMAISEIAIFAAEQIVISLIGWLRKLRCSKENAVGNNSRQYVRVGQVMPLNEGGSGGLQLEDLEESQSKQSGVSKEQDCGQLELLPEEITKTEQDKEIRGSYNFDQNANLIAGGAAAVKQQQSQKSEELNIQPTSQFSVMRSAVSVASFNFLFLNNAVLCPATMIIAVITNALLPMILRGDLRSSVISFMDVKQTRSSIHLLGLLAVMCSVFFTLTLGFSSAWNGQYFTKEFSYLEGDSSLFGAVKILTSSQLLCVCTVLFAMIALQQRNRHQEAYDTMNETIISMRKAASNQNEQ